MDQYFLYPWAVVFQQLGTFGLLEIVVFSAAVFVSYGALTWSQTRRVQPLQRDQVGRVLVRTVSRGVTFPVASRLSKPLSTPADGIVIACAWQPAL